MPQVDKIILMPQVFWLVFIFLGVYFYISRSRLKPYFFYLKFKYSFFLMNLNFYLLFFVKNKSKIIMLYILKKYLNVQKKLFLKVNLLEFIINNKYKNSILLNYKFFYINFFKIYIKFIHQYEKLSKNII